MTAPVYPLIKPKGRALRAVRRAVLLQVAAGTLLQAPKLIAQGGASTALRPVPLATPPGPSELPLLGWEPKGAVSAIDPTMYASSLPELRTEGAALPDASAVLDAGASAAPFYAGMGGIVGIGGLAASAKAAAVAGALIVFGAGLTGFAAGPLGQAGPAAATTPFAAGGLPSGTTNGPLASGSNTEAAGSGVASVLTVPTGFGDGPGGTTLVLRDAVDVPEPASLLTFALGAAAAIRARRRARIRS